MDVVPDSRETTVMPVVDLRGGVALPMVGFGTWDLRGQAAYDAIRYALQVGYRHLDTATMYGNEAEVGRAVRDAGLARDEVFLTTKLRPTDAGREKDVLAASLRALDTDYVDLWLIHAPPRASVPVWQEFQTARDAGMVRSIGVSNFSVAQLDELIDACAEPPAVNQIPWSPRGYDPALLAANRERSVVVEGYSPLKGSDLRDPVLFDIAGRHGVTPAQVVLRWHIQHGVPVIPKSANPTRMRENIDLFDFELTPEEMARVDALSLR
jgi:diketogulonate reductase-like aldo/keto reductase